MAPSKEPLKSFLDAQGSSELAGSIALGNSLLISSGSWADVGRAALSVRDHIIAQELKERSLPALAGLRYWRRIRSGGFATAGVFAFQCAPEIGYNYLRLGYARYSDGGNRNSVNSPSQDANRLDISSRDKDVSVYKPPQLELGSVSSSFKSVTRYTLFWWKALRSWILGPARYAAKDRIQSLSKIKNDSAVTIGKVLSYAWDIDDSAQAEPVIREGCHNMAVAVGLDVKIPETPEVALELLQDVLNRVNSRQSAHDSVPSVLTRWWPALVIGAGALWWAIGSWNEITVWFQVSIVDTLKSLWENWIVEPLVRVYRTVRHDPNEEIVLMSKKSLQSDLESLERMVVSFVEDTKHSGSNKTDVIDELRNSVRQGDLTPVLKVYEKEISSPVYSILTGKLIRAMLIQVQKTKVDVEVALDGVDKMLQSQQLVFGLVAALPAGALLLWFLRILRSRPDFTSIMSQQTKSRDLLFGYLGKVESLAMANPQLDAQSMGDVFIELSELKTLLKKALSSSQYLQVSTDIDRLIGITDSQKLLDAILRIYSKQ